MEHKNFQHFETGQSTKDEKIVLPTTGQWAILFFICFLPIILGIVISFLGANLHWHLVGYQWSYSLITILMFLYSFRIGGGGYARMAARRMWTSTGTPMVLIALIPPLISIAAAVIQMRGLDHLELSLNFLNYEYKGVTYQYIPQYWFQDWLTPILSWILDLWVVILILSILRQEARDRMVGIFLMLSYLVAVVNHFVSSRFYPIKHSYHLLYSSTTAWWIVAMAVSSLSTWIIYRSLERGFRPSLMPIVIYLTMSLLHVGMFERPSDGYSIISHVLGAGAVWLLLRKSKWGVEKWTEYQQGQETLQT